MTMTRQSLPFDILIQMFTEVDLPALPAFDLRGQRATFKRNELLVCCALVCRTWAVAARHVLYRDITLGITFRKDASRPWYTYGDTTESLALLTRRLHDDTKLAQCVRGLHLGYGFAATRGEGRGVSAYTHTYDLHCIAMVIARCPKLTTLTLDIGMRQIPDEPHTEDIHGLAFLEKDLARMEKKVKSLRELRILHAWHESTYNTHDPKLIVTPSHSVSRQLICTFSGSLTHLRIQLPYCTNLDPMSTQSAALPSRPVALPRLRTVVADCSKRLLEDITAAAPELRQVSAAGNGGLAIPDMVTELYLTGLSGVVKIGPSSQLRSLSFDFDHRPGSNFTPTDPSLYGILHRTLRQFPQLPKLKEIRLPARGFWHPEAQLFNIGGDLTENQLSSLAVAVREVFATDAFDLKIVVVGSPLPDYDRLQAAFGRRIVVQFEETCC